MGDTWSMLEAPADGARTWWRVVLMSGMFVSLAMWKWNCIRSFNRSLHLLFATLFGVAVGRLNFLRGLCWGSILEHSPAGSSLSEWRRWDPGWLCSHGALPHLSVWKGSFCPVPWLIGSVMLIQWFIGPANSSSESICIKNIGYFRGYLNPNVFPKLVASMMPQTPALPGGWQSATAHHRTGGL